MVGTTTQSIDYLQRAGLTLAPLDAEVVLTRATGRRLWRIRGIGREEKRPQAEPPDVWRQRTEDLISGLYAYRIPIAFGVLSSGAEVRLFLGTWSSRSNTDHTTLDRRLDVLGSVLRGLYPVVVTEAAPPDVPGFDWPLSGLAVGIPTAKRPVAADPAVALDRLLRGMSGSRWGFLILAYPVAEQVVSGMRDEILNEMREAEATAQAAGAPSPLTEHYVELLKATLRSLIAAGAEGAWRTAAYLFGDNDGYPRLASLWRSVFSGDKSLPEPVRVFDVPHVGRLAGEWALPDQEGQPGPSRYRRPLEYQTILTSSQLAAYVHLPEVEAPGFTVEVVPEFDVVPQALVGETGITLGSVVERTRVTEATYSLPRQALASHAFVTGVTGAGKTNTIFHLLREIVRADIPFLVIEPAKTEYRALVDDPELGPHLHVFTPGAEWVSPLRVNPFEILPGISVGVHLDLLRSVFTASFGMWVPLPQVLEQCLIAIYEDRGWDIASRYDAFADERPSFPTLTDLVRKVEEVVPTLGFDPEAAARVLASLTTRLNGLRTGGKGRLLDVRESIGMELLLEHPTVLELEALGDDDDKAFFIGLLLVRLVEYRRHEESARPEAVRQRQHLLVIEEAHRLLTNVARSTNQEQSDPRGKAVETFTNLLSEIRAYGQGVLVADQVASRLAPDVIKNTGLKIAHRVVSGDDREVLGSAMAMSDRQVAALSTLPRGRAAVFAGESDDAPLLVEIPSVKDGLAAKPPSDDMIHRTMSAGRPALLGCQWRFRPTFACETECAPSVAVTDCMVAKDALDAVACRQAFGRLVLSAIENPAVCDVLSKDLFDQVRSRSGPRSDARQTYRCFLIRASSWLADRRGSQGGWSSSATDRFETVVRAIVLALPPLNEGVRKSAFNEFQNTAWELHGRASAPYPFCEAICRQSEPVCLYRYAARDLLDHPIFTKVLATTPRLPDGGYDTKAIWNRSWDAGTRLIAVPNEATSESRSDVDAASRRASLCFAQQVIESEPDLHPRTAQTTMFAILKRAGIDPGVETAVEKGGGESEL